MINENITYAKANDCIPMDYKSILFDNDYGQISDNMWEKMFHSFTWLTGPCGSLSNLIPRYKAEPIDERYVLNQKPDGMPLDTELVRLNHLMANNILHRNHSASRVIFNKIEERSSVLINEIKSQNGKQ
jgi:hypothetical protein